MKPTVSDLAIQMHEGVKAVHGLDIFWREFLKFIHDFEEDNNVEVIIKKRGGSHANE